MLLYNSTSRFHAFSLSSEGQCCIPYHGSGLYWDYSHLSASVLHWGPRVGTVMWWHSPVTCSTFCSSARAISAIVPCVPITATNAALSRTRMLRSYARSQTQSIFMVGRNWRPIFHKKPCVRSGTVLQIPRVLWSEWGLSRHSNKTLSGGVCYTRY